MGGVTSAQSTFYSLTSRPHLHPGGKRDAGGAEDSGDRDGPGWTTWGRQCLEDAVGNGQTGDVRSEDRAGSSWRPWWEEGPCSEALSQYAHLYPELLLHFLPLRHPEGLRVKTLTGVYAVIWVLPQI